MVELRRLSVEKVRYAVKVRGRRFYSRILNLPSLVALLPELTPVGGSSVMDCSAPRMQKGLPDLKVVTDCIYSPEHNGLYDLSGNLIPSRYRGRNRKRIPDSIVVPPLNSMELLDTALFGGILFPCHFGHFLTESMSRLWPFYFNHILENRDIPILFRAASSSPVSISGLFLPGKEIFIAAGLLEQVRISNSYILVKKMIVPEPSLLLGDMIHQVHADYLQYLGRKIIYQGASERRLFGDKVYYSRARLRPGYCRKIVNEPCLERELVGHGYSIVCPETYSLADQVSLFNEASEVAGPVGSAFFTMLLTCNSEVKAILFLENTNGLIDYINVAGAAGVNLKLVTCIRNHPLSFNNKENSGDKVFDINGTLRLMGLSD